jgi:hypothetical protein
LAATGPLQPAGAGETATTLVPRTWDNAGRPTPFRKSVIDLEIRGEFKKSVATGSSKAEAPAHQTTSCSALPGAVGRRERPSAERLGHSDRVALFLFAMRA